MALGDEDQGEERQADEDELDGEGVGREEREVPVPGELERAHAQEGGAQESDNVLDDRAPLPKPAREGGEEAVPEQLEVGEEDEQHRHDGDLPDGRKVKPEEADDRDHHGNEHVEADVGDRAAGWSLLSPVGEGPNALGSSKDEEHAQGGGRQAQQAGRDGGSHVGHLWKFPHLSLGQAKQQSILQANTRQVPESMARYQPFTHKSPKGLE